MNFQLKIVDENANVNNSSKQSEKHVILFVIILIVQVIPLSNTQIQIPTSFQKKKVHFSSLPPTVCVYDKNKSVVWLQKRNAKQINIHKQNPEIQFFQPETKKNSRLRSPVVDRHPILIDPLENENRIVKRRKKRQKRLAAINLWQKRKERQQRLLQLNKVNLKDYHIKLQISALKLSMQFGELSDDFYEYCRRWKKVDNTNENRNENTEVKQVKQQQPSTMICFNFRFFTKIMMKCYKDHLQIVT